MMTVSRHAGWAVLALALVSAAAHGAAPEIRIFGSAEEIIAEYQRSGYWGAIEPGAVIEVPPYLTVVTSPTWDEQSAGLPVEVKKELFYRSLLPLILYVNESILEDRERLKRIEGGPPRRQSATGWRF